MDALKAVLGSDTFAELSAHTPTKMLTEKEIDRISQMVFEMHTSIEGGVALDLVRSVKHWYTDDCDDCGSYLFEFLIGLLSALAEKINTTIGDTDDLG